MKNKPFAEAIKSYLDRRAADDPQFAESYANPKKNIIECCDYIVSEVRKQNRTAMTDDEVYGLAVHYYDEGKAMHHCVYSAGYWKRADSLVMTARVDGRRMETVEVNTAECIVRQSRGVCNSTTEWHDKIISLVMKNMPKMRAIFIKNNI